tara:strand:+ start:1609 stop:1752 length:144 start_codon:yes stop_codon:yes gene_type:complete
MGYLNPDYYYHQLLMDKASEVADLKNQIIRLEKKLNQLQKESKQCQN